MMKNNKLIYIAIIILILLLSIFFIKNNYNNFINYILDKYANKADTVLVSDTIITTDTLLFMKEKPVTKYIETIKTDTVFSSNGDSIFLKTENKAYQDTFSCKNDTIILQSYISGINSNLDSIKADWRKSETVITNTTTITKYIEKKRTFLNRFSFGPSVTAGYDPINKQWGLLVGASITFDLK